MRQIIFRAKRKDTKEWVYGYLTDDCFKNKQIFYIRKGWRYTHQVDEDTIGQYTGLNGRNGELIFEGDLVRFYDDIEDELIVGKVIWHADSCSFCVDSEEREIVSLTAHWEWEVVGNIHDSVQKP